MLTDILILLLIVGAVAGFIDTIAGGGGMLTVPALLMSGLAPETALATNKFQASFGSVSASWYFIGHKQLNWRTIFPGIIACAIGASCGTLLVQLLSNTWLEKIIPVLLIMVGLLFILLSNLGEINREARLTMPLFAISIALPIGFYDGFLGPGTGSFFLIALISLRGLTLQQATIQAKAFNAVTNVTSLIIFFLNSHIVWSAGIAMATGQLIGARLASRMIITKGNRLIRPMVITMSIIMSAVLAKRYWF